MFFALRAKLVAVQSMSKVVMYRSEEVVEGERPASM